MLTNFQSNIHSKQILPSGVAVPLMRAGYLSVKILFGTELLIFLPRKQCLLSIFGSVYAYKFFINGGSKSVPARRYIFIACTVILHWHFLWYGALIVILRVCYGSLYVSMLLNTKHFASCPECSLYVYSDFAVWRVKRNFFHSSWFETAVPFMREIALSSSNSPGCVSFSESPKDAGCIAVYV